MSAFAQPTFSLIDTDRDVPIFVINGNDIVNKAALPPNWSIAVTGASAPATITIVGGFTSSFQSVAEPVSSFGYNPATRDYVGRAFPSGQYIAFVVLPSGETYDVKFTVVDSVDTKPVIVDRFFREKQIGWRSYKFRVTLYPGGWYREVWDGAHWKLYQERY